MVTAGISASNDNNKQLLDLFDHLRELVPSFNEILDEILVDACQIFPLSKYVRNLITSQDVFEHKHVVQMMQQAQSKRQEDTNEIKTHILRYMEAPPAVAAEITSGTKESMRGFNHPTFAHLLVPRKWLDQFDHDPECATNSTTIIQLMLFRAFMNKVKTRDIRITSWDFPTFLYDDCTNYEPEYIEKGLLRGKLLVRVSHSSTEN